MKVTKITFEQIYSTGVPYLNQRLGMEIELLPEESEVEAYLRAKAITDESHRTLNPHLYPSIPVPSNQIQQVETSITTTLYAVDEQPESIETLIQSCPDIEALKSFELIAIANGFQEMYEQKMKELS